jgi:nitrate/TMAO reductase-like tetraheme cytochrome c subunit
VAALLGLAALPAAADKPRLPPNPVYKAECGSCHVAFPPKLLPAESWARLMARLDRHFGSDASLDAKASAEIGRYLATNAGRRATPAGDEPRITETRWFRKEHHEVSPARWNDPAVKGPANCVACHKGAEEGMYGH